jgi:hypothetical protein
MVCITPIFEALEHVVLNPSSFHNVCLEFMLFALFKPGRVTWCHNKLVSLRDGLLLGRYLKSHCSFPSILTTFHPHPFHLPIVWALG